MEHESLVSPIMKALNEEALLRARAVIKKKFIEPSNLNDISALRNEIQIKLSSADAQLKGAVQGKLDGLKRAVDLMDESTVKLKEFTENIEWTESRILQSNTAIVAYPNLKTIHYARENLNKVIAQVEYFARIPDHVSQLRKVLDDDPGRFKEVYLESLKLEAWRSSLLSELQVSRNNTLGGGRKSVVSNGKPVSRNRVQSTGDMYSSDMYTRIIGVVGNHLEIVLDFAREVRNRLWGNIERIFDVANRAPADLVATFEIIEMHQDYVDRRVARAVKTEGKPSVTASDLGLDSVREEAMERLKRNLDQRVEANFLLMEQLQQAESQLAGSDRDADPKLKLSRQIKSTLGAATSLLSMMTEFKNEVGVCIPPRYNAILVFVEAFEQQLQPQIVSLVSDTTKLEVSELMQLIDWLEYCIGQMTLFEAGDRPMCKEFLRISDDLINDYLYRIKSQVMEWFGNIKRQPIEVIKTGDGTLVTTIPEDMFNVIHMQIAVARDKLPREHLKDVVNACLQTLREVQRQSYDNLAAKWTEMDPESLCATINDTQRMQEKCEEFSERVVTLVPQEAERAMLEEMLEEVSSEYISLAVKAVNFLMRLLMSDLEEPVLSRLFTSEWEGGEPVAGVGTMTLQDYFADLSEWLPPFFFSKLMRECLVGFVSQYVMALRKVAVGNFQFGSELSAGSRVITDMEGIKQFFSLRVDVLKNGGMVGTLEDELLPLQQLAKVITATHISGARSDVVELYIRWGKEALKVVQCAIQANPSLDKAERAEGVDAANRIYESVFQSGLISSEVAGGGGEGADEGSKEKDRGKGKKASGIATKFNRFKSFLTNT